ncbi:MAG: anion permease [Paracoccus sp. (in: a-proteobacteria)]|nr:anion permease [Paracoccus sp. (in: a-proteobacteria)]
MGDFREFRVLDKDLRRLSHAEQAGFQALRPLHRLGLALVFLTAVALAVNVTLAGSFGGAIVLAGVVVAAYLALNIGANDVANSAGTAIGAGALPLGLGLALVACAQLAGALLAGGQVAHTIGTQVVAIGPSGPGAAHARVMLAALIGAALWVNLAVWLRAPVSTTHSVIGAIAGAGLVALGPGAVNWHALGWIASGWVIAPVVSAGLAAAVFGLFRWRVHFAPDRRRAALFWLPAAVGLATLIFALYLVFLILGLGGRMAWVACGLTGLGGWMVARWHGGRLIAREKAEGAAESVTLRRFLSVPLAMAAILSGFAHGANDLGNVVGPLSILLQGAGDAGDLLRGDFRLVVVGGIGIALGSLLYGRRVVHMVGSDITRLNAARAFVAVLAAAATVIGCSALGLPVSTTHCAVAGVFGIGFYREAEDSLRRKRRESLPAEELHLRVLVRRSHVRAILLAWIITLPCAAVLSALCWLMLSLF